MPLPDVLVMPVPFRIPPIGDKLLAELVARIRPVIMHDDKLHFIEPVHPRDIAFTWGAKATKEAVGLVEVVGLKTLHEYGAPALFKPSIAEVLAQIPAGYIDTVVAFHTRPNDENINDWPEWDHAAMNYGFHLADTVLYRAE